MSANSHLIKLGDHVIFKTPSEQTKVIKLEKSTTVNLGKFGSFSASKIIGQPFGLTYEIENGDLTVMSPKIIQELEETHATNEYINDGEYVQPLTYEEIEALKKSGANASEIINLQISQHANYSLKTEYSKEKYKKRKEAKYNKTFTTVQPNLPNLLDHHNAKDPSRVMFLRVDSVAQMLTFTNVREGGRYIVVEDCGGLVTGAILERMGGKGRLFTIHDADSPPAHNILQMMNLSEDELKPLGVLNWATADPSHTPIHPPAGSGGEKFRSDRERRRLEKRKEIIDQVATNREELFAGEFDGLISVSQYEPYSIVQKLGKYLAGSANVVLYSPYPQVLSDVQSKMRDARGWLNLALTEGWLRRYQVLPGRTHPEMNTQGSGGFLLHAIKIHDDPNASSFIHGEIQSRKRRKLNAAASASGDVTPSRSEGRDGTEEAIDMSLRNSPSGTQTMDVDGEAGAASPETPELEAVAAAVGESDPTTGLGIPEAAREEQSGATESMDASGPDVTMS